MRVLNRSSQINYSTALNTVITVELFHLMSVSFTTEHTLELSKWGLRAALCQH